MTDSSKNWIDFQPPAPGETAGAGSVIGSALCHDCGEPVLIKLTKSRIAYGYCNGKHPDAIDPRGCGGAPYKWGRVSSNEIIRDWSRSAANDNTQATEEADEPEEEIFEPETDPGTESPGDATGAANGPLADPGAEKKELDAPGESCAPGNDAPDAEAGVEAANDNGNGHRRRFRRRTG